MGIRCHKYVVSTLIRCHLSPYSSWVLAVSETFFLMPVFVAFLEIQGLSGSVRAPALANLYVGVSYLCVSRNAPGGAMARCLPKPAHCHLLSN